MGFSLGGNLLLKYLGETAEPQVRAAVAVSVPFVLRDAMLRLNIGRSKIYREHLMQRLKETYRRKRVVMPGLADPGLDAMTDFFDFDDRITAPLNGFAGADDYYARCSCRPFLRHIRTPTLILHALDDPFMFSRTVPRADELGPGIRLEWPGTAAMWDSSAAPCPGGRTIGWRRRVWWFLRAGDGDRESRA